MTAKTDNPGSSSGRTPHEAAAIESDVELESEGRNYARFVKMRRRAETAEARSKSLAAALEECIAWMVPREKIGAGERICDRALEVLAPLQTSEDSDHA